MLCKTELPHRMEWILIHSQRLVSIYLIANLTYREVRTKKMKLKPLKASKILKDEGNSELQTIVPEMFFLLLLLSFLAPVCIFFVTSILASLNRRFATTALWDTLYHLHLSQRNIVGIN